MKLFEKYKSLNVTMKATIWYLLCNIIQKGIQFFTIPLYVRLLSTEQYGNYNVYISWRDILIIPITLNLYCGIFTKAMVDYENDRDRYTSSMQGISTTITFIFFIIYLCFNSHINKWLGYGSFVQYLLFAYYFTFPAYSFWTVRQRVEQKYKSMVVVTLLYSILTPLTATILIRLTDLKDEAIIIGTLAIQSGFGLVFYIIHFIKSHIFFVKKYWMHALKYNIPLIPHYLSLIVLAQADRIMIRDICGSDKAGIYSVAYQISSIINIIVAAINSAVVPWLYSKFKYKSNAEVRSVTNFLCVIMGMVSIAAMLIAPEIIKIIGTDEYYEAVWIVPAVVLSAYLAFCNGFFTAVEFYYNATKYVMFASSIGAVVNIILNYIFINKCGYIAAGYTTLVCYFLFYIAHYIFMKRVCVKNLGEQVFYDEKTIMISVLIMFGVMIGCLAIYQHVIIRYIICALIIICVLLNWRKVMNVFNQVLNKHRKVNL